MPEDSVPASPALNDFRTYLTVLARVHMARSIGGMTPSDIVQLTLLEAHRGIGAYRGKTQRELGGWLRSILARQLARARRDGGRAKRDARRDVSLERELERSSLRLAGCLTADRPSPSQRAIHEEAALAVARALLDLPEMQQRAIVLHYLEDRPVAAVAESLGVTRAAVAGHLRRGLERMREVIRR